MIRSTCDRFVEYCRSGQLNQAKLMLAQNEGGALAKINQGYTTAAGEGRVDMLYWLDSVITFESKVIDQAVVNGAFSQQLQSIRYLVTKHGQPGDEALDKSFEHACRLGASHIVKYLLKNFDSHSFDIQNGWEWAIRENKMMLVVWLQKYKTVDPAHDNHLPFALAAMVEKTFRQSTVMRWLVRKKLVKLEDVDPVVLYGRLGSRARVNQIWLAQQGMKPPIDHVLHWEMKPWYQDGMRRKLERVILFRMFLQYWISSTRDRMAEEKKKHTMPKIGAIVRIAHFLEGCKKWYRRNTIEYRLRMIWK